MLKPIPYLCYLSPGTGMSSMPAPPWRRPRGRSSCGSRAMSWWTGQMKATAAASTRPEPQDTLNCLSIHSGPTTSVHKNLSPPLCSAHLSRTHFPVHLLPQPRSAKPTLCAFCILSQREIGSNPFHATMPDYLWGVSKNG